jgi:hypothetical protein
MHLAPPSLTGSFVVEDRGDRLRLWRTTRARA